MIKKSLLVCIMLQVIGGTVLLFMPSILTGEKILMDIREDISRLVGIQAIFIGLYIFTLWKDWSFSTINKVFFQFYLRYHVVVGLYLSYLLWKEKIDSILPLLTHIAMGTVLIIGYIKEYSKFEK